MSEIQIAWLELIMIGSIGVMFILLGVIIDVIAKRHNQLCTKQT